MEWLDKREKDNTGIQIEKKRKRNRKEKYTIEKKRKRVGMWKEKKRNNLKEKEKKSKIIIEERIKHSIKIATNGGKLRGENIWNKLQW